MTLDRREFVKGALGASGVVLLGNKLGASGLGSQIFERSASHHDGLPEPGRSGIEHVVLVMMENRSFDHILGWLPRADGRQAGLSYKGPDGKRHKTHHQKQLNGCGFLDPDHSYEGGRIQYNGGRMDGFLTDTANDSFAISYYKADDRPFMGKLARHYTTCDRYFCSILGPTFPNRVFQHAGQTDRLSNTFTASQLPTIWDRLNKPGGPTGRYYYSDLPILALWGSKYTSISSNLSKFMTDAAAGTLPNVSFVDPSFLGEGAGTSNDDHPLADLRAGDAFLSQLFHAVASGPGWKNTVFIINYDEWGGFFEHVPARRVTAGVPVGADPSTGVDQDLDAKHRVLTGFRVPCIIASPFARARWTHAREPSVLRPHVGLEAHRTALGPRTTDSARRVFLTARPRQLGARARLRVTRPQDPEPPGSRSVRADRVHCVARVADPGDAHGQTRRALGLRRRRACRE